MRERALQHRPVNPTKRTHDRVGFFWMELPPEQQRAQDGDERDRDRDGLEVPADPPGLDQRGVDTLMRDLDGTDNKSKLGANAILAVSCAVFGYVFAVVGPYSTNVAGMMAVVSYVE